MPAVLAVAAWCVACAKDSTGPSVRLAVAPEARVVSVREDSLFPAADSALVVIGGADAATAPWVATHTAAPWLTLLTPSGAGGGYVRWVLDTSAFAYDTLPKVFADTVTIALRTPDGTTVRLPFTLTIRSGPAQFITVRRAWLPGERDALASFVVRNRSWGEFSDVAAQVIPTWDSTTEVIQNPAWRPSGGAAAGIARAPMFTFGWPVVGIQSRVIFDSIPGNAATRDSLQWMQAKWFSPTDSTWQGYIVAAPDTLLTTATTVNTAAFDATFEHRGVAAGEAQLSTLTYWEADGGTWKVTTNSYSGAWAQIASGAYLGGDIQATGQQIGAMKSISMPRLTGTTAPKTQRFNFDYSGAALNAIRIRCYFTGITPPTGFHQCTGVAAAAIVRAARAGKLTARMAAGLPDPILPAPSGVRRTRGGRRQRRLG